MRVECLEGCVLWGGRILFAELKVFSARKREVVVLTGEAVGNGLISAVVL